MKRILKEIANLSDDPLPFITTWIEDENYCLIHSDISGPKDSPYENGNFKVDIRIPERYPFEPPFPVFLTKIYHPNIDDQGRICLDLIKLPPQGTWKPTYNIRGILTALEQLLLYPNPEDPLIVEIANEFKNDYKFFFGKAKDFTMLHAVNNGSKIKEQAPIKPNESEADPILSSKQVPNKENEKQVFDEEVKSKEISQAISINPPTPSKPTSTSAITGESSTSNPSTKRKMKSLKIKSKKSKKT